MVDIHFIDDDPATPLSAAKLNQLVEEVTAAQGVPDAALAARVLAGLTRAALDGVYIPRWRAYTIYQAGQQVVLPDNQVGSAKANFTTGPAFSAADWNVASVAQMLVDATPTAEMITRTNYVTNADCLTTTNYAVNAAGGAATLSAVGGRIRSTWTANSTASSGINAPVALIPGPFNPGDVVTVSMDVKSSRTNNVQLGFFFRNGTTTVGGGSQAAVNPMVAGVERRLTVTGTVTNLATNVYFYLYYNGPGSGGTFAQAGDTLELSKPLVEKAASAGTFFSGSTPTVGNVSNRWAGVANASASYQMNNANLARRSASGTLQVATPATGYDAANKAYVDTRRTAASVLEEGAKGDANAAGGTNDSAAFQAAVNKVRGTFGNLGGDVLVPGGRGYYLDEAVRVYDGIRVLAEGGATIWNYAGSVSYSSFETLSGTAQGYGSGGRGILFEGITFQGCFTAGSLAGNCVTLHHGQDVTFRKCTWREAIVSGHGADLMGCDGVLFDDCVFEGFKPQVDREYVEAIQVDYSIASAGGSDIPASFDGLPTINVTVRKSKFRQLTVGGVTYPAPNPIGSHSRVATRWHDNILFDDNYVEGGDANLAASGFSVTNKGWIHFLCARNVTISRTTFKNVGARLTKVVYFNTISTGTALADVQNPDAPSTSMAVMPVDGFVFDQNTLVGFTNDTVENLIEVKGTDAAGGGVNARRIKVTNNLARDCYSTRGVSADKGANFLYLQDVNGAEVHGNDMDNVGAFVYAFRCKKLRVSGGTLVDLGTYAGRFSSCTDTKVRDVDVDGHGGGWWAYGTSPAPTGFSITGGSILNGRADAVRKKHVSISGGLDWQVEGVRMPKDGNGFTSAIDAYTNSARGIVTGNFAAGWDAGTFLSLGVGSTTSIYDRNVYA